MSDNTKTPPFISKLQPFPSLDEARKKANLKPAKTVMADGGGLRYSKGKPRWDLIPPDAMIALAELYEVGAEVYGDRNWERGMLWGECFRAACSHLWKFWLGEEFDRETGCHHTIMAAWNCFALYCYWKRKIGEDDRNKIVGRRRKSRAK